MRERTQRFLVYGFLISIALHLIGGSLLRFERTADEPERIETVRIDVMPTPPPTIPPTLPPTPTPPPKERRPPPRRRPVTVVVPRVIPRDVVRVQPPVQQTVTEPRVKAPDATAAPAAVATPEPAAPNTPVAVVPVPPQAIATAIDPAMIAAYNSKLNAAVQAAFRVPAAAADIGFKGRVRVEFALRDGVVSDIRILQPSGLSMVDRAAITAVESAKYPLPPQVLQGKNGTYQIWVTVT